MRRRCPAPLPAAPLGCLRRELMGDADDCSARCVLEPVTECSQRLATRHDETVLSGRLHRPTPTPIARRPCGDGFLQVSPRRDVRHRHRPPGSRALPHVVRRRDRVHRGSPDQRRHLRRDVRVPADHRVARRRRLLSREPGANFTLDPDCRRVAATASSRAGRDLRLRDRAGSCPDACPVRRRACTPLRSCGAHATTCSATLRRDADHRLRANGDGCCPAGCTRHRPRLPRHLRRRRRRQPARAATARITAGQAGRVPATCDDGDACTVDLASGSAEGCTRSLRPPAASPPASTGDGCCPAGCPAATDATARRRCGDGRVGAGETCDPPSHLPHRLPGRRRPLHGRAAERRRPAAATSTCVPRSRSRPARARPRRCLLPDRLHVRQRLRTAEAASFRGQFGTGRELDREQGPS